MKLKNAHLIFVFSALLITANCAKAQLKRKAPVKSSEQVLPFDKAVRTGKLANGFTYYIRHNEEPKNRVVMYLVNKVGSVLEDDDQQGLAHFMEHMSFNGTTHFPHNEVVNYLQKSGIRFGADINAYTSFDETVYELPLPSDKPEIFHQGIEIMHDWAQSATLDAGEIDKERGVVLEEKRLGKGAGERMQRQYWPVILNNSRYAVRVPIGLDTVLNNFKRPTIARFYHDWYRPDLQALIVVGDINADSLEKVVRAKFSDLKNPEHERPRLPYGVPIDGKNHFIAVTDKEMTGTVAQVLIKHSLPPLKTAADYHRSIATALFNRILAARYAELSRTANPLYLQGNAGISGFISNLNSFNVSIAAKPGELESGFKAVWREVERVRRFGYTQTELDRVKKDFQGSMDEALKEKDKTGSGSFVKEYQEYFLKGTAAPGIVKEYDLVKESLPAITLNEVNGLTKTYITNINRDILVMAPEKEKSGLPNEQTFNNWINAVAAETLEPYQDKMSNKPLLTTEPIAGKIIAKKHDNALNITALTLSNGIEVLLKPTAFKNDQIIFSGSSAGGNSLSTDAEYQSAASAASIVTAGGAGNYSQTELQKYLSGKQVGVSVFIAERNQGISGSSTVNDLETALQLSYAYLSEPRKDKEVFDGIISRSKAAILNRGNDPKSVFNDSVSAVLGNHSPRRTGPSLDKLSQIKLDVAYDFYKARFANATGFTFTFIGSFDVEKIKPLLEKYLGGLPSLSQPEMAKDLGIQIPEGKLEKTVYKGTEPQSTVILVYSGKYDYNAEDNISMDALKETLEIRLIQRLREEESGVYSPGVFVSTGKYPQARFSLVVQFGCAPKNVEKLIASAKEEINKLKTDGPLQDNVDKWRTETKTVQETALKTNGFWLNYLNKQLENKEDVDQVNQLSAVQDQVTPAKIKQIAAKYLSGDNYIRLVLLPEQKTP
ncbi:M16 family metallopeptidase [Mucilaginibacter sp. UYCu711]|uniref:M16 family metallopeptidase n=1 Tax=Mucilaginibacter sp. UYCu711 TaxID=3156339 RepID=UPI003D24EEA8